MIQMTDITSSEDAGASVVQPIVSWSTLAEGPLTGATGLIAQFTWRTPATQGDAGDGATDAGDAQDVSGTWTIVAPATPASFGSVQAPAMPTASGWGPTPDSIVSVYGTSVAAFQGSLVPSFASVRAGLSWLLAVMGPAGVTLPLPQDGTIVVSSVTRIQ
jgi:hypothetical protein